MELQKQDVVLFGEFHNNPISHWLQLEVTTDCRLTRDLVLGAGCLNMTAELVTLPAGIEDRW